MQTVWKKKPRSILKIGRRKITVLKASQERTFLPSKNSYFKMVAGGFPGGSVVKNPPANAGDMGSSPGQGRSHMPRSN